MWKKNNFIRALIICLIFNVVKKRTNNVFPNQKLEIFLKAYWIEKQKLKG